MPTSPGPRVLLALSFILATAGIFLAHQAWVADPRLRFSAAFTYVIAAVALVAAVMVALQSFGLRRWNDLLAAVLLLAVALEFSWLAFGPGHRPCRIGWWQPPEPVCRTGLAVAALFSAVTALWALHRQRQRTTDQKKSRNDD